MDISVEMTSAQTEWINNDSRELLVEGSAGSGKTIFACYKVIFYALNNPNASIYVYRVTLPALKKTSWKEIRNILDSLKLEYEENKTDGIITFPNNSKIFFGALDELSKVRSLNADLIYIEQAEELTNFDFYVELMLRLGRGEVTKNGESYAQMLLVVQPESENHWIYQYFHELADVKGATEEEFHENWLRAKKERQIAHFHYSQNYKLPLKSRQYYDNLKDIDYELWLRYSAGKWGKISNVIYPNYDTVVARNEFEFYTAGVDFGFNNPACFLLCGWFDNECYVLDEVYQSELLNNEFIVKCTEMLASHDLLPSFVHTVFCDAANPDKIEEFKQNGYNAKGGVKDVTAKIQTTKQTKLHISSLCSNTLREIKGYKWKSDKDGVVLDEPVKLDDHAMDALGYNVYGVRGMLSPNRPINPERFYNNIRVY